MLAQMGVYISQFVSKYDLFIQLYAWWPWADFGPIEKWQCRKTWMCIYLFLCCKWKFSL